METPEQVLEANLAAYNAHDLAAYIATFAPEATFGQLGGRTLLDSRTRMEAFFRDFFGPAQRPLRNRHAYGDRSLCGRASDRLQP